jgi:hypothetical protein
VARPGAQHYCQNFQEPEKFGMILSRARIYEIGFALALTAAALAFAALLTPEKTNGQAPERERRASQIGGLVAE